MSGLKAFFAQNALKVENEKVAVSKRFLDDKGNPIEWEIKAITPQENEQLREKNTRKVKTPGKKQYYMPELKFSDYTADLVTTCVVTPNLNDAELQDSYNVMDAAALIRKMLTPGEYDELFAKVQEINGFEIDFEDKVEEVKN